jgi:hypothetical protein
MRSGCGRPDHFLIRVDYRQGRLTLCHSGPMVSHRPVELLHPQPVVSSAPCERVSVPDDEQAPRARQAFELVLAVVDEMEI